MVRPVGRVGVDLAGGVLATPLYPNVTVNGAPIAVVKTKITPHGKAPHNVSMMATGSPNVFVGAARTPVCSAGDLASCGHPLISKSNVFVN
jgi:uncharacterized Zn-binding protein involved in type VI secretion